MEAQGQQGQREFRAARADLERMLQSGSTYTEIARNYGFAPDTVSRACRGLGLPRPTPKAVQHPGPALNAVAAARAEVEGMLLAGATYTAVARKVGFSISSTAEACRKLGLPEPKTAQRARLSAEVLAAALAAGRSHVDIAREHGTSSTTVRRRCRALGLPKPRRQPGKKKVSDERLREVVATAESLCAAGRALGVSAQTVAIRSGWRRRAARAAASRGFRTSRCARRC